MEENGGFLHIIFLFIGVACLSLGIFYYLTDMDKVEELIPNSTEEKNSDNEEKKEETVISNTIVGIDIKDNEEKEITLGNGNKVKLSVNVLDEEKSFLYNDDTLVTFSDLNLVNKFYVYNDYVIIFSYSLIDKFGTIYTIDNEKQVEKIEEIDLNNRVMRPVNVDILDNKLIVDGSRIDEDNNVLLQNGNVSICSDDELSLNSVLDDSPLKVEYSMNIVNKNVSFDFIKIVDTVLSTKKIVCTNLE